MAGTFEKLLDAAETRIRSGGFHAVSFRDLADDLGIKSASVHYHFRHKEDLGVAVVTRYALRFFAALDKAAGPSPDFPEKVSAFCGTYRSAYVSADSVCLCGVLGAEAYGLPDKVAEAVATFLRANINWLAQALMNEGRADARDRASFAVASLQGGMMLAVNMKDVSVFETVIAQVTETLLAP